MIDRQEGLGGIGWGIIPPSIMVAKDLTPNQKLVWGRISGLKGEKGYCFAGNEFLGAQIGISKGTMANIISEMSELGYLNRILVYRKGQDEILVTGSKNNVDLNGYKYIERRLFAIELTDSASSDNEDPSLNNYTPSLNNEDPSRDNEDPSLNNEDPSLNNEDKVVLDLELDSSIRKECVKNTNTFISDKNNEQKNIDNANEVIAHIESVAEEEGVSLNFDRTTKSRTDIVEGIKKYSIDELKLVAEMKCKEWIGDAKTMRWVNPNTLFRDGKINNNVVAARAWAAKGKPSSSRRNVGYRGIQSDDYYESVVE